jgi:hypothetical protein
VRQEGDGGTAERAGEVEHRGVDRHEDVDLHQRRRGVRKIAEQPGQIGDGPRHAGPADIGGTLPLLQTDQRDPGKMFERQHGLERHAAAQVGHVTGRAGPHEPDGTGTARMTRAPRAFRPGRKRTN